MKHHPSSFRDPSSFIFTRDNMLIRQINTQYQADYEQLMNSGLYKKLTEQSLLISHTASDIPAPDPQTAYKIIAPEPVSFISYPYEWCFNQLKDAALTTLSIQKLAIAKGMSLKDASAYNIQFHKGKPVFIDTCSFEKYQPSLPWAAYRQFCRHFLCPLALSVYLDSRLNNLLRVHIDGIPIDLASTLLPLITRFNIGLLTHIHLHAKSDQAFSGKKINTKKLKMTRTALEGILNNLVSTIKHLKLKPQKTEWATYYNDTNYSNSGTAHKKKIVAEMLRSLAPKTVWDLGANTGVFSNIAAATGIETIAFDNDPSALEQHYRSCRTQFLTNVLPLWLDLANPSPAIGWQNQERMSLIDRGPADTVMVLAMLHHLAIGNNVPFEKIAEFLSSVAKSLIIEFIPKEDLEKEGYGQYRERFE